MRKTAPEPMAVIDRAEFSAPEKLDEIREWNRQQNGQSIETADGGLLWSASVVVDESYRLRLHLENVDLPDGVQMWVHSDGNEHVGPFGAELADGEGNLWTPSVAGPELTLVVLIPGGSATADFTITRIAELFKLDLSGDPIHGQIQESDLSCMEDAACVSDSTFGSVDQIGTAMAHLHFMKGGDTYVCSGGLITDTVKESDRLLFLTVNHCISAQSVASSLEAYWN